MRSRHLSWLPRFPTSTLLCWPNRQQLGVDDGGGCDKRYHYLAISADRQGLDRFLREGRASSVGTPLPLSRGGSSTAFVLAVVKVV